MDADIEERIVRDSMRVGVDFFLFGVDEDELDPDTRAAQLRSASLLAGVMWQASITLVDKLFEELAAVHAQPHGRWAEVVDDGEVLYRLPERFWPKVTPGFANKFTAAALDLTSRVARGWSAPACVAQELALKCLLDEMEVIADTYAVPLPEHWRPELEQFLFEDLDHEYLYAREYDGFENDPDFGPGGMMSMAFDDWFIPFDQTVDCRHSSRTAETHLVTRAISYTSAVTQPRAPGQRGGWVGLSVGVVGTFTMTSTSC